ncbi:MAG: class II aldolase/adducin family protein [Armatimonadota bacterium]|nr:class II aldolase/adducin family protein [Armatimonadota bacterium]
MAARDAVVTALADQLVALARRAYHLGLTVGTSGNLSARIPGTERVLIKASGQSLGDMTAADTLLVDLDGQLREPPTAGQRPSREVPFHLAIYRARPDVGAVIHLHPPHVLAFAAVHELPPLLTGASRVYLGDRMALIPVAASGSAELAGHVARAFQNPKILAAIMAEHGSITAGPDLPAAFYLSQYLEDAARTAILAKLWRVRSD